ARTRRPGSPRAREQVDEHSGDRAQARLPAARLGVDEAEVGVGQDEPGREEERDGEEREPAEAERGGGDEERNQVDPFGPREPRQRGASGGGERPLPGPPLPRGPA